MKGKEMNPEDRAKAEAREIAEWFCYSDAAQTKTALERSIASAMIAFAAEQNAEFPNIGTDPLKMEKRDGFEESLERLKSGRDHQQKGVPDQTALVWRMDISRVSDELIFKDNKINSLHYQLDEARQQNAELVEALREIADRTTYSKVSGAGPAVSIAAACGQITRTVLARLGGGK